MIVSSYCNKGTSLLIIDVMQSCYKWRSHTTKFENTNDSYDIMDDFVYMCNL